MRSDGEGGRKERQKLPRAVDYQTWPDWLLKRLHGPCGACCGKPRSSANEYNGSVHPLGRCFTCWRGSVVMVVLAVSVVCLRVFHVECIHVHEVFAWQQQQQLGPGASSMSACGVMRRYCASNPACVLGSTTELDWQRRKNWHYARARLGANGGCDCVDSQKSAQTSLLAVSRPAA